MKKRYLVIGVILLVLVVFRMWCSRSDRNKRKHSSTVQVCNKYLFVETFKIFESGAYGGDRVSEYLTDSINFRIYIGTFDNSEEAYSYECKNDSLKIYKVIGIRSNNNKISSILVYNISALKKKKIFE